MPTLPLSALGLLIAAATPAAVPFVLAEPADPAALPSSGVEILEGETDRFSRMTVPVTIEGQGPFQFMIDTGSQATVITAQLRDRLGLPTLGRATIVGMAARKQVDIVQLDGLEFAARVFDNIHAPLLEAQHIGADGILGLDSLQGLRVLIDFRTGAIAVNDARSLGGDRGYEIVVRARHKLGRLIITDADVDGVRTAVIIDTGAQGSVGNRALQRRLRARTSAQSTATDVTGARIVGDLSRAGQVTIGRGSGRHMAIGPVGINYADAPAFESLGLTNRPALVLGMEDLRLFDRVAIDFADNTLLFDLPPGAMRDFGVARRPIAPRS